MKNRFHNERAEYFHVRVTVPLQPRPPLSKSKVELRRFLPTRGFVQCLGNPRHIPTIKVAVTLFAIGC